MQFFQTNLEALQATNPHLAQRLLSITDVRDFEIFMDANDITTLNLVHTKHFTPLYEGSVAATIQAQSQEYEVFAKHPYLYIYGVGNGVLLKHLLSNQTHKRILVVEPEVELLYVVLHMIDFSEEITSGRLVVLGYDAIDFPTLIGYFLQYPEHKQAKTYTLHINTSYYDKLFSEHMQHTNRIIIEAIYHAINIAGNDTIDSLIGLKHHIANLARVLETPPLSELLNKLHTCDTAVLVSTGPSLTKQLPLLKEIAPYVRIIAVDASFPVLYKAGIKPDVVVSIERVQESARFFTDMPQEAFNDVVFALSSVQHTDVVKSIKGGVMQMSLRPLNLMMYIGPEHWGYIGIGQSAANMAYELIYHSEFKNCILIGQDLAYGTDGKSHASGHVFGEENVKTKESDVWVKGWQGNGEVRTNHTWDMFRRSFEKDIGDTKVRMLTINATEGGTSIYGTLEIPFAEAIAKYVAKNNQKTPLHLLRAVSHERERIAKETWAKVDAMTEYVAKLLDESKRVFLDVAMACEQKSEALDDAVLASLVQRVEAIKGRYSEEIYEKVVWHIAQTTMLSKEIELAPAEVFIAKDAEQERERLLHLVEAYKPWLFLFSGILDAILHTIEYAKVRRLIDELETIDVFVAGQKIDSFTCHELEAKEGRIFDVDMRGIMYDVPDAYQEQIDEVVFRDAKNAEELPRAFVDVFKHDDAKYNELSFMRSLEESFDAEKLKTLYTENAIGFMAYEESLKDEQFIKGIKELSIRFPQVVFKAFYLNAKQREEAETLFSDEAYRIEFVVPKNIYDIAKNIEIFLYPNHASRNVYLPLIKNTTKIACLDNMNKQKTIHEIDAENANNIIFKNPSHFDVTEKEFEKYKHSYTKMIYERIYHEVASNEYSIDTSSDGYEFYLFERVRLILNIDGYKDKLVNNVFRKLMS